MLYRHARTCSGHPRLLGCRRKAWMAGTSPAMTVFYSESTRSDTALAAGHRVQAKGVAMIRKSPEDAGRQSLGMLSVAAGVSVFSLQDASVKGLSGSFPVDEIVFVRSLVAFPLLLIATIA